MWLKILSRMQKLARSGRLSAKQLRKAADQMKWSPKKLERELLAAKHLPGLEGQLARDVVSTVGEAALGELTVAAAEIAAPGILASLGAAMAAIPTWGLLAGAGLIIAVGGVAGYIYSQGEDPVEPGSRLQGREPEPLTPEVGGGQGSDGQHGVFLAGNYVLVGQQEAIEATASCDLLGWGNDCSTTVGDAATLTMALGLFGTFEEAQQAYCDSVDSDSVRRLPLVAAPLVATLSFDGQEHNISNAPDC